MKAMKAPHHSYLSSGLAALLLTPVLAIEPPADDSPPPAAPKPQAPPVAPAEAPAAKPDAPAAQAAQVAPYLGVGSSHVPDVLAAHLGLKPEEGIVIRALDPNGPAAKAGLVEHDVITRIGGQPVGSHADLVKQVQSHQAGDEIKIDLVHQGKPVTKAVTLTPRPDGGGIAAAPEQLDNLMLEGMPDDQFKRIREAIDRQLRAMEGGAAGLPDMPDMPDMDQAMKDAQKRMDEARKRMAEAMKEGLGGGIKVQGSATVRVKDNEGSVELKSVNGGKEATVRDLNDREVWSGPWDTEQDKAAAPPEVRARIEKLNIDPNFKGQGLRLNLGNPFGNGFGAPAEDPAKEDDEAEQPAPEAPEGGPVE
jgi:hypothetical protein